MDDTAARLGQDLIHPATLAASQVLPLASCESVRPAGEHAVSILQESHTRSRHPEAFLPELD
ncbi:uncharacterized protein TRAVEDRAFT_45129 [Trametes versicolor FP-101664 SS1]|uniref:uncharacterized protein n=1 Tax=Trametes versicolor (strain FP-101664) TaxID=717944 RepID=UPI0004621DA4|nr:uncharacterized protein TRAVEDRAFT_45129 [Trametes versicolor FP-101664 SS1]EIW62302.1 hypothetical protein TRAVEDRAFT_45129 [Trametes versicolor FP-101664 SS1]